MIRALGEHYGFDVEDTWIELPEQVRQVVLYGSGKERIKLKLPHEHGPAKVRPFEGILRNMDRRYRETDSITLREELARYLSHQDCPTCQGTRLNEGGFSRPWTCRASAARSAPASSRRSPNDSTSWWMLASTT